MATRKKQSASDGAAAPAADAGPALAAIDEVPDAVVALVERRHRNLEIWDRLKRTDPRHTKPFQRSGGFKGTAIKPIWSQQMMTQEFGPIGKGWGVLSCDFTTHEIALTDEILVFCKVEIWWRDPETGTPHANIIGIGGDKIVVRVKERSQNRSAPPSYYWNTDDEAYKKAYTDAMTNAFKLIGIGADVHMGQFDDSKYYDAMLKEFQQGEQQAAIASPEQKQADAQQEAEAKAIAEAEDYLDRLIKSAQQLTSSVALKEFLETESENYGNAENIDPDRAAGVRVQLSHMMRGLKAAESERAERAAMAGSKPSRRNPMFDRVRAEDDGPFDPFEER